MNPKEYVIGWLDSHYKHKWYSDHNYPTPVEIVEFVEKLKRRSKKILADRNLEWVLNGKVVNFKTDCERKLMMLKLLQEKMNIQTKAVDRKTLNTTMRLDISKTSLRTNYPFEDETTGNLKAMGWPVLLKKDWDTGYKDIQCVIPSAWALSDTSNDGSTNRDARAFIIPKLNWFVWNDLELFKPHATVQTCTIDVSRNTKDSFDVYGYDFTKIYTGDKHTDKYIFKTALSRELYKRQQAVFGQDYTNHYFKWVRNQSPVQSTQIGTTHSLDKDGNWIKPTKTDKVDAGFGSFRAVTPMMGNTTKGNPRFVSMNKAGPKDIVRKDYTYYTGTEQQVDSMISLCQTKTIQVLFEDTMYSRSFTAPTFKFVGQFPLDREWTDTKVLKYIKAEDLKEQIDERHSKGF